MTHDIREITPDDDEWPARLRMLGDGAPERLWVRGNGKLNALAAPGIAIVGSRSATPYGAQVAGDLARDLSAPEYGYTVVSGGAFGIDAAAHCGALAAGKPTIAVLACGVDRAYPARHADLFDAIAETGCVVSAYEPGSAPTRERFLARNRLIAALAYDLIIVEGAYRSGSMNAVKHALELDKQVYAVPGPVTSAQSEGPHRLIKSGQARLITTAADVVS